jgi:hypothetical protein
LQDEQIWNNSILSGVLGRLQVEAGGCALAERRPRRFRYFPRNINAGGESGSDVWNFRR